VQEGDDLGERMLHAFKKVFDFGCKRVSIIGSDCYELRPEILHQSFEELESNQIVIGPATDGGYYLLGMSSLYSQLFTNIEWGTSNVLEDTLAIVQQLQLACFELAALNDIDTMDDLLKTDILTELEEQME
jgi:hypothetical protein